MAQTQRGPASDGSARGAWTAEDAGTSPAMPIWADFPTEEYQARVARAQRAMRQAGLDVLLLSQRENVEYFSGFRCGHWMSKSFSSGMVLIHASKDPVLVIPDFFAGTAQKSSWFAQHAYFTEPHARPHGVVDTVVEAVTALAGPSPVIGIETGENLVSGWNLLDYHAVREGLAGATFASGGEAIWACRMIKSPREIERLRTLTRITERAMLETREQLHVGMTETEIAAAVATAGFRAGADGVSFLNIRSGLDRYPMVDGVPTDRAIGRDEILVLHPALTLRGYISELSHNTVVGEPTPKHREVWRHIVKAQEAGLAAMRPGARARDVFGATHRVLADYGFGRPNAYVGHGIGLTVVEPPMLTPYDDRTLEPGMVFALELWISDNQRLGIFGLGELVAITEDGHDLLS